MTSFKSIKDEPPTGRSEPVPEPQTDPYTAPCTGDNTCPWCNLIDSAKTKTKPFAAETVERVTKYLLKNPRISPTMAGQALGLSRSTITYIRKQLIDEGKLLPIRKQGARKDSLW